MDYFEKILKNGRRRVPLGEILRTVPKNTKIEIKGHIYIAETAIRLLSLAEQMEYVTEIKKKNDIFILKISEPY